LRLAVWPACLPGVDATSEHCVLTQSANCWVIRGAPLVSVSIHRGCFAGSTVPRSFGGRVHSLLSLLLFGVTCVVPPCCILSEQRVLPGFLPSSRLHRRRPLVRKHSLFRYVPSSGFLNLSTASSASGFAGLFHPAATSRVSRSGVSLVSQLSRLVAGPCPLAVVARTLIGKPIAEIHAPRLRGFSPRDAAFSRSVV